MAESLIACGASLRRAVRQLPQQRAALERIALLRTRYLHQAQPKPKPSSDTITTLIPSELTASIKADAPKTLDVNAEDPAVSEKKAREKLERAAKKNLQYLDDPWKLGQYVSDALAKDRFDEALLLTQKSSSKGQMVVSWSHLINYQLEKQQLRRAVQLYNEMKKRGQLPNALTYTVLFRGFAKSQHPKLAVSEAIKHYQILLKDSRLEPNTTHLNAVLNVCSRAGDLDSMFSILDTVNESTRTPDAWTYATIINAIRFSVTDERQPKDLPEEQKNDNIMKAINRAMVIWEEAISRWRKGRLVLDETMVCAMGRLILMTPDRVDKRGVLDLIEQTMNIPNLSKPEVVSAVDFETKGLTRTPSKNKPRASWVPPGPRTLALVLTTLSSARLTTCGIKYWNLLVREHGVQPDLDIWMRMFGMLKLAKSSAYASTLLDVVPDEYINSRMYQIAMETCVRDNINHNAIKNSNKALESMMKRLRLPDPHTMRLHLRVSLVSHYQLRERSDKGDADAAKHDYAMQISNALDLLWEPYRKLHNHYFRVVKPKDEKAEGILYNNKREVIALARIMYGSFNKIIQQRMLPDADLEKIRPIGARINREIHAFFANREELEPNLRRSKGRGTAGEDMSDYNEVLGGDFEWDTTLPSSGPIDDRPRSGFGDARRDNRTGEGQFPSRRENDRRDTRGGNGRSWSRRGDDRRDSRPDEPPHRLRRGYEHLDHDQPRELRGRREPFQRRATLPW